MVCLQFMDQKERIYSCYTTPLGHRVQCDFPYDGLKHTPYLACCESADELAMWACETVGIDPYETTFLNPKTGEVLYFEDLEFL